MSTNNNNNGGPGMEAPDLTCTVQVKSDQQKIRAGLEAWVRLKECKTWEDWLVLGEGLLVGAQGDHNAEHSQSPGTRRIGEVFYGRGLSVLRS